ncbi:MAG: ImmA/IrrE family metallo-endopeptidase [Solirubrobacteraceae bacterium]
MKSNSSNACSTEAPTTDPATAAQALLREFEDRYGASNVPPVPVERIANSMLGLLIEEHDDIRSLPNAPKDQGHLSGMLDARPTEMTIWVDATEARRSPQRRRFTIAHEIGHLRLHVPPAGDVFADRAEDIRELPLNGDSTVALPPLKQREDEADRFARELLMPELLVIEHARDTGFNLPALAERFDLSVPAIRLRLRLLGVLPKYMA